MAASLAVVALGAAQLHCPDADGAIIGLVSDETYNVRVPADYPQNPEKWTLVDHDAPPDGQSPVEGSFTGRYIQVLPDDRSSYHDIYGPGSFTMTGLEWMIEVITPGRHTLHLRWTAGDDVGGGDSLYALMRDHETDAVMPGRDTLKPKLVGMREDPGQFVGCCYDMHTHACPCCPTDDATRNCTSEADACAYWQDAAEASGGHHGWEPQCDPGLGEQMSVPAPKWYLYAGKNDPTKMSFNAEPWDATCEAEATSTKDTGQDTATWELLAGRYSLVLYPREDGTAVDAFYLAGPRSQPPTPDLVLAAGASTTSCDGAPTVAPADLISDTKPGGGVQHDRGDAEGWGHHSWRDEHEEGGAADPNPGLECGRDAGLGLCLEPIGASECPPFEELEVMSTCDNVTLGMLCEADGECGTDVRLNNCSPPKPDNDGQPPEAGAPRLRGGRNNDVYRWVVCESKSKGSSATTIAIIVVLLLALCVLGLLVVRKPEAVKAFTKRLPGVGAGRSFKRQLETATSNTAPMATSEQPGAYIPPA